MSGEAPGRLVVEVTLTSRAAAERLSALLDRYEDFSAVVARRVLGRQVARVLRSEPFDVSIEVAAAAEAPPPSPLRARQADGRVLVGPWPRRRRPPRG